MFMFGGCCAEWGFEVIFCRVCVLRSGQVQRGWAVFQVQVWALLRGVSQRILNHCAIQEFGGDSGLFQRGASHPVQAVLPDMQILT